LLVEGENILRGNDGSDTLYGGDKKDVIHGGNPTSFMVKVILT
jgi:Ca2+-binding RTX toxin-like protein